MQFSACGKDGPGHCFDNCLLITYVEICHRIERISLFKEKTFGVMGGKNNASTRTQGRLKR
jgi:hypothetical protein